MGYKTRFSFTGMAEVLFNPQRIIEMLIYPRHGSEGSGMGPRDQA